MITDIFIRRVLNREWIIQFPAKKKNNKKVTLKSSSCCSLMGW